MGIIYARSVLPLSSEQAKWRAVKDTIQSSLLNRETFGDRNKTQRKNVGTSQGMLMTLVPSPFAIPLYFGKCREITIQAKLLVVPCRSHPAGAIQIRDGGMDAAN
jgi:hypothetical protein